jgi:outer membrane protein insertion porin family
MNPRNGTNRSFISLLPTVAGIRYAPGRSGRGIPIARSGRLLLSLLLLLLFSFSFLHAQPSTPTVTGSRWFTVEQIRSLAAGRGGDSLRRAVQAAYAAEGYLDASVTVDSLGDITVVEGNRFSVSGVRLRPDSLAAKIPLTAYDAGELVGGYYSSAAVEASFQRLVRALNDLGYPLAIVRLGDMEIVDSVASVNLTFDLIPGDRVTISEIDIRGNDETSRSLILTAASVPPGATFTDDLARQVRSRLVRLNVFTEVAEPQLYRTDSGAYGLLLTVKEGNANTFDGVIGYQPPLTPGGEGNLTGLLNFIFRNIGGSGRRFQVRGQWPTKGTRELEVRYGEPFVLGFPLDIEVGYRQHQEAETSSLLSYVQHYLTGDLFYGFTDALSFRLGGAIEQTIPEADSTQPCSRQLLNTSTLESTFGVVYDTRSDPVNPLGGLRFSTSYTFGSKAIRGPSPCDTLLPKSDIRQRNEVDLETYLSLGGPLVLANGLHGGDIRGNLLQESDLFQFGGQSTVRGYRENQFRASRRLWGTGELRFLLASKSFVSVFFDGGYYNRKVDTLRGISGGEEWIYGYGVGGQIETPLGLVRLSFALGKEDTFETGKVFIGLVNQF